MSEIGRKTIDKAIFLLFIWGSIMSLVCTFVEAYLNRYSAFIYVTFVFAVLCYTICFIKIQNEKKKGGNCVRRMFIYVAAATAAILVFSAFLFIQLS